MKFDDNIFDNLQTIGDLIKDTIRGQNAFIQIIGQSDLGCNDPEERVSEVLIVFSTIECIIADYIDGKIKK